MVDNTWDTRYKKSVDNNSRNFDMGGDNTYGLCNIYCNFDITNLNLCCNMCGEKIDESSNYVITPCTHFLHTACIKNKILSDNNKDKDVDAILDKAMDEFLNKENNEECEDCDVCKSLF